MRPVSVGINPTAATLTTVYTVPTGYYAKFTVMYIHNTGGSTKHITVQWYDASAATTLDILTAYDLTTKQYLQFDGNALSFWKKAIGFRLLLKVQVHSVLLPHLRFKERNEHDLLRTC